MLKPFMLRRIRQKRFRRGGLIALLALIIFSIIFIVLPIIQIKKKAKVVVASIKEMKSVVAQNDIDLLDKKLKQTATEYEDFRKSAHKIYWLSFIPYVSDFKQGVEGGHFMMLAGQDVVEAIKPYADLIGFKKGTSSFVERSSEDRLQTAVLTLDKVLGKIDGISANIEEADKRIATIDPNRYPKKLGKTYVRDQITQAKEQFQGLASLFVDAKPLLKNLPDILGKDKDKTYLVLFQNKYEQRATGGFLTFYAVFDIKEGKIKVQKSDDIYSLDDSIPVHPPAPEKILLYHKDVSRFYIRDSNLSPDFPASVELFNSLYEKSSQRVKYDGIITIDAKVLVDMLKIFGDTEVQGIRFSADTTKECDCAQVIYKLFDIVDRPVNYVKIDRKRILGDLMYTLLYKAIGFSPSKYWGTLVQVMFKDLDEKHILLYFTDPEIQTAVVKLNYGGAIKPFDGDYLHVNNVNFAGAKSNLYVSKTIDSETTIASGKIQRKVTVEFRNPYPASDCNLERGGLCLNAILRNWIRFYVPKGAQLGDFKGSIKPVKTYDELGKTVFEGFLTVPPLGKAEVVVTYTLPSDVDSRNYKLMVQKQPGEENLKLNVKVGNNKLYDGILDKDKILKN